MNVQSASRLAPASASSTRALTISLWVAQIVVAGILGMGAFAKFFNYTPEGSMLLAEALGVGRGAVTMIGVVDTAALLLILLPGTRAIGALLAVGTMLGALVSHVTALGFSGGPIAEMWPMAVVVLLAAAFVLWVRRGELPLVGQRS